MDAIEGARPDPAARDAKGEAVYRPTCHYAYHPCDDAVLSLHELFGRAGKIQPANHILTENEIVDGIVSMAPEISPFMAPENSPVGGLGDQPIA